jgi:hypothetical protein
MAINSFPSQAGGGQANLNYIGSIHMETYNRRWEQGGSAGYYALYSTNQENGYAYFVGNGTSTGAPLNRLVSVTHPFTRVDIIAPVNDMMSLYKGQVKSTSTFPNPFDADGTIAKTAIPSFPSVIRSSGNFVLPNNALPLVNVLVAGGGAQGGHNHCGGGGAGGCVVKLNAYQAVGTTAITIGSAGGDGPGHGGRSYFGNVYALGGGGGGRHSSHNPGSHGNTGNVSQSTSADVGNGGGAGGHNSSNHRFGGSGFTQTSTTGLGTSGTPTFFGGYSGGNSSGTDNQQAGGGGGAGAGGAGTDGNNSAPGNAGPGHASDITGSNLHYGTGGAGGRANSNNPQSFGASLPANYSYGGRGAGHDSSGHSSGDSGVVVVRYYIP